MNCDRAGVPEYLQWNDKKVFNESEFEKGQGFYRVSKSGNDIEFPSILTAYSCKWDVLIEKEHILTIDVPSIGDNCRKALIEDITKIEILKEKNEGNDLGVHHITCVLEHAPNPCDYSHTQINIRHRLTLHDELIFDEVYSHNQWAKKETRIHFDGKFYKTHLRKEYRKKLIQVFKELIFPVEELA
ncbi:MAG: hypothetical protein GC193_14130 [Cryomorphaceae bacterium]|nr:hypothetical protein [Cryomorphaceae bacterium]